MLICLSYLKLALFAYCNSTDTLNLAHNRFEGSFPSEWTEMASLKHLDVSNNDLDGEIPIFIDGMKNLRSLNLAHNDFSSTIPIAMGR